MACQPSRVVSLATPIATGPRSDKRLFRQAANSKPASCDCVTPREKGRKGRRGDRTKGTFYFIRTDKTAAGSSRGVCPRSRVLKK